MDNNNILNNIGEVNFDSSLHIDLDKSLNYTEYVESLVSLVEPIIRQRFHDCAPKQEVYPHHDRVAFACPYCGDSTKNFYAKRGNFILSGKYANHFKCHNCGEFKRIDKFFKEFNVSMKLDAINYMSQNLGDFRNHINAKYDMSLLMDMGDIDEYAVERSDLIERFGLVEVSNASIGKYLKNRLQYDDSKFLYHPLKNYLLILNLTKTGKVIGFQQRLFKGANRFTTYKLSKIYEALKRELNVDDNEKEYLDTISMVFNICLVDFNRTITMFEGPMDAFLYKNAIANTGANKELPIDIPVKFFFDDDDTGRKNAIEEIEKGHDVFLWDKYKNNIENLPYRVKWDWNDIMKWSNETNTKIPRADMYFSSDPLDIIDI